MKELIIEKCKNNLREAKANLKQEIEAVKESMGSDTKSSAGDKYETGREMMNQERDKFQAQVEVINRNLAVLQNINTNEDYNSVQFGAFVETSAGKYFISISYGNLDFDGQPIVLISAISPLAQLMIDKKVGDKIDWNGKQIMIEAIH